MSDAAPREQTDTETEPEGHGLRVPFSANSKPVSARAKFPARRTLAAAIAAKLTLDLLFVCALAVYTQAISFGSNFEGALEYADGRTARGWVRHLDEDNLSDAFELQLYIDGRFAAAGYSASPSQPGSAHGGRLGFELSFGQLPQGEHEARVYAVSARRGVARLTLRQIGGPLRFVLK
jgi:hypothetical protein